MVHAIFSFILVFHFATINVFESSTNLNDFLYIYIFSSIERSGNFLKSAMIEKSPSLTWQIIKWNIV